MPRYRLTLEYDGRGFNGWQRQENGRGVQQAVEKAIARLCGQHADVMAAGRTDAGVHATGQVAHVDLPQDYPADTVREAINFHLKPDAIAVLDAAAVDDDFHARFSAIERQYRYRIVNRRAGLTFDRGLAWQVRAPLDVEAMHAAAQRLLGHHDFTTFRAAQCQAKSSMKTLDELTVTGNGQEIVVFARARSFLHHQVRSMVGSLRQVGAGKWSADDLTDALAAADRTRCGPVAPPDGLYLSRVVYPPETRGASG